MLLVFYIYRFYFRQVIITTSYDIVSYDAHKFLYIVLLVSDNTKSVKE